MKPLFFALLILCFITSFYQTTACSLTLLLLFSLFFTPFFFIIVPGGFAWQKHYNQNPKKHHSEGPKISCQYFLGFLPQMGPLAHRKLAAMASSLRADRLMAIASLGSIRVVVSSHPETAKEILCGTSFSNRPVKESTRLLMFDRAIGFSPYGNYWRHLRRIASSHMFSPRRISSLEGSRQAIADKMVEKVHVEMNERGFVELRGILQKGSLDNMLESVFGIDGDNNKGGDELELMVKEGYEIMGEFSWGDYFTLGFLDICGLRRRCNKLGGRVSDLVSGIVRERREGGGFKLRNDFLSVLLSLNEEDQLKDADMVAVLWVCTISFPLILFIISFFNNIKKKSSKRKLKDERLGKLDWGSICWELFVDFM